MLVLCLFFEEKASRMDFIAAHVLFVALIIGFGTGSMYGVKYKSILVDPLVNIAYFFATMLALMLCVYYWNTIQLETERKEDKKIENEPSYITAQTIEV